MSDLEILLAIPLWLTWMICAGEEGTTRQAISTVSMERLRELAPRLFSGGPAVDGEVHQLVRFNLLNLGAEPVTVCSVTLARLCGEQLSCDVFPSVVVAPGARHPFLVEITKGPVSETVEVDVEMNGCRVSVPAQSLPRSE